eukprot:1149671-Pelagomonas_calceolata.AAC.11
MQHCRGSHRTQRRVLKHPREMRGLRHLGLKAVAMGRWMAAVAFPQTSALLVEEGSALRTTSSPHAEVHAWGLHGVRRAMAGIDCCLSHCRMPGGTQRQWQQGLSSQTSGRARCPHPRRHVTATVECQAVYMCALPVVCCFGPVCVNGNIQQHLPS